MLAGKYDRAKDIGNRVSLLDMERVKHSIEEEWRAEQNSKSPLYPQNLGGCQGIAARPYMRIESNIAKV